MDTTMPMTDRDKVARLATEVMGWYVLDADLNPSGHIPKGSTLCACLKDGFYYWSDPRSQRAIWSPLESIADAMAVQTKILAMPKIADDYLFRMADLVYRGNSLVSVKRVYRFLLEATARQRCDAAISALEAQCQK